MVDVLDYGDTVTKNRLSLLNGPGNDMVAIINLAAAGAHRKNCRQSKPATNKTSTVKFLFLKTESHCKTQFRRKHHGNHQSRFYAQHQNSA